jgi:hypothetical protein
MTYMPTARWETHLLPAPVGVQRCVDATGDEGCVLSPLKEGQMSALEASSSALECVTIVMTRCDEMKTQQIVWAVQMLLG